MTIPTNNPLAYLGTAAVNPPTVIKSERAPTTSDKNYPLGTIWINQVSQIEYSLVAVTNNQAIWVAASGTSDVNSLSGDSGSATPTAGDIIIAGGTNITTAAAASTVTVNLDAVVAGLTSVAATTYTTNVAAAQLSIAGTTITAAGTDANINVNLTPKGTGSVIQSRGAAAGDVTIEVTNTDNTSAASRAGFEVAVGGTSAGDPYVDFLVSGAGHYVMGIDNSVASPQADPLVVSQGAAIGTNNLLVLQPAGEVQMPLQPSFLGYLAATATNKTGNGTPYTIGTDALTEVYDRGSDFTTAGVFTAPVDGIYDLRGQVTVTGNTVATTFVISIVTTGTTYTKTFTKAAGAEDESVDISVLALMSATNTATLTITVSGEAGDTSDIKGGAALETFFCGCLVA